MKKKSKAFHTLISVLFSFFGYVIYYIIFQLAISAFCPVSMAINVDAVTESFFPWCILIVESIYMLLLVYYFHKQTKGMTTGYLEGCMLLWLCGISGYTIISRQQLKTSIAFIKDIKCIAIFLIVLSFAAILYKSVPENKKQKSLGKKYNVTNKKRLCTLLAVPAGLLAYGIYRLLHIVIWTVNVQFFIAPDLLERNHLFLDILIEVLSGCYFAALLRNFHKKTNGMLTGYMEAGFLLWIPLLWKGFYENGEWINRFNDGETEKWFLFVFLFILIAVSIHDKKKKEKEGALRETNMGLTFLLVISGYGIYCVVIICISIVSFFHFQLALIVSTVIFGIYFFVIQQLSKGKLKWELLIAYGVFLSWALLLCSICIVQGLDIGTDMLGQKEYMVERIKDMVPNLEMYFAYGISVLAGEVLAWRYRRRHGKEKGKNKNTGRLCE